MKAFLLLDMVILVYWSGCNDGKVRGVNMGGWFVMEPWITPKLFEEVNNGGDKVKKLGKNDHWNEIQDKIWNKKNFWNKFSNLVTIFYDQ